jgi:hypothetical protein
MGRYSQGLIIPEGPGKVKQGLPDFRPKSSQRIQAAPKAFKQAAPGTIGAGGPKGFSLVS